MKLPAIRSTRVKKLNVKGLPKGLSITPWSNQQMLAYTQSMEDIVEENNSHEVEFNKILNLQFEMLVLPNLQSTKEIKLSLIQKQLLMVELFRISRAVRIELEYPCSNEDRDGNGTPCNHITSGYFNLNDNVIYDDIKERSRNINGFVFHISEANYVELNPEDENNKIKYLLGFVEKVTKDGVTFEMNQEELFNWVMNETTDHMFDEIISYLTNNVPNIKMVQEVTCELCGHKNIFNFQGIPAFS